MNRREFLATIGVAATAVAIGGLPLSADDPRLDEQFRVGDMLTIEGYYARNPITLQFTPHLQYFVVTDVTPTDVLLYPTMNHPGIARGISQDDLRRLVGR